MLLCRWTSYFYLARKWLFFCSRIIDYVNFYLMTFFCHLPLVQQIYPIDGLASQKTDEKKNTDKSEEEKDRKKTKDHHWHTKKWNRKKEMNKSEIFILWKRHKVIFMTRCYARQMNRNDPCGVLNYSSITVKRHTLNKMRFTGNDLIMKMCLSVD